MKLLIVILFLSNGIPAQSPEKTIKGKSNNKEVVPVFQTAGEQEEYNVKQMFKNEYKEQEHFRYNGLIKSIDNRIFVFDSSTIAVNYTPIELKAIFGEGLLYPALFGELALNGKGTV